jgi:hypothetical protein
VEAERKSRGFQQVHIVWFRLWTGTLLSARIIVRAESMPIPVGAGAREICLGIALAKRICEAHFVPERRAGM